MLSLRGVLTRLAGRTAASGNEPSAQSEDDRICDTKQSIDAMREAAEIQRARQRREKSAREIQDACRKFGVWWPGEMRGRRW